jgi:hypothetical protein
MRIGAGRAKDSLRQSGPEVDQVRVAIPRGGCHERGRAAQHQPAIEDAEPSTAFPCQAGHAAEHENGRQLDETRQRHHRGCDRRALPAGPIEVAIPGQRRRHHEGDRRRVREKAPPEEHQPGEIAVRTAAARPAPREWSLRPSRYINQTVVSENSVTTARATSSDLPVTRQTAPVFHWSSGNSMPTTPASGPPHDTRGWNGVERAVHEVPRDVGVGDLAPGVGVDERGVDPLEPEASARSRMATSARSARGPTLCAGGSGITVTTSVFYWGSADRGGGYTFWPPASRPM